MNFLSARQFFTAFRRCRLCNFPEGVRKESFCSYLCDDCFKRVVSYKYKSDFASVDDLVFSYSQDDKQKKAKVKVKSLFRYEGDARTLLLKYKMEGEEMLKSFFYPFVDEYLSIHFEKNNTLIIPLPCSKKGYKIRGFDQCIEILKGLDYKWCDAVTLLKKQKKQQKELSSKEREEFSKNKYGINRNILNAYIINGYSNFIFFDDVLTTGSSLKSVLSVFYPYIKTANPNAIISSLTLFKEECLI